ncbi:hypothetical protein HMF7854_04950 [Sphingomonas ginkgonis]|uniref:Probable membrane transporter protein n=1 Tax=Sphingomonas ginkgonis TaxID=2315330 RepID=A0A429V8F6_9SPHN|nr:TSUP family transporter [Sphingomonas ginkgonis]RST30246.1 hypothetical protein HMF7854_04950 [Sphingomonas ginkgonis]
MLDPWLYPLFALVAVGTGFIDAIAGGGGLIMMPALLFAGVPPLHALAANKLQSVFGTSIALRNYWRGGLVDWRSYRGVVLLVFAGAAVGGFVVQSLRPRLLDLVIPLLLAAVALYVLLSPRMHDKDAHQRLTPAGYAPLGALLGFYDGFFGPGAGTFYTTSLVALRGHGLTRAAGNTKLLNFTSNLAGVVLFIAGGRMWWTLGLVMAAGAVVGGWLGSHTAMRFGARLIRPLLVIISLALTAKLLWSYFH